jgi:hypothetical protein
VNLHWELLHFFINAATYPKPWLTWLPCVGDITKRALGFPDSITNAWPSPNYVDPIRRDVNVLYTLNSIFLFSALVCVALRLYTRTVIRKWFGLDDVFIVFSVVSSPVSGYSIALQHILHLRMYNFQVLSVPPLTMK